VVTFIWLLATCARSNAPPVAAEVAVEAPACGICLLQRPGDLPAILRRAVGGASVPTEDIAFGHCFVCTQCPGEITPTCHGWWPEDPAGGDYEGDDGLLQADADEVWTTARCAPASPGEVETVRDFVARYDAEHTYQVINRQGGRSCLGFCIDVADQVSLSPRARAGDLTIPGNLRLRGATLSLKNERTETPEDLMFRLIEMGEMAR